MKINMWSRKGIFIGALQLSLLLLACGSSNSQQTEKNYTLSGKLEGYQMDQIFLIDLLNQRKGPVDTAAVNEAGEFRFDYQPDMKGFYRIGLSQNVNLVLPLSAGEEVVVKGDVNDISKLEVSGTKDALRMMKFNRFLKKNYESKQALDQEFKQFQNSPKRDSVIVSLREKAMKLENEKVGKIKKMIDEDPALFSNLALIEQLPSKDQENLEYYKKVEEALAAKHSNSPFYQNFQTKVDKMSRFAPGSEVPEINLPNPEGEMVPLSSLRGKVVLIDFWASWCKPCRRENPNVVAAYEKYKDKGFTVYGVSLDRSKEAWVKAIEQDNLNWTQVSDLKFWQSEAAQDYGVSGIPFALLIDEEGKVIGKNLRGQELHRTLEKVLN